jgi:hypothetical protein
MKRSLFAIILIFVAFAIAAQERIDTPVQVSPTNLKVDQMPNVMLDWNAVTAALNYQVLMSDDAQFSNIIIDSVTDLTSVSTVNLIFGKEYFWKVRANNMNGEPSFWTPTWSFTTFLKIVLDKPNSGSDEEPPDAQLKWKNRVANVVITGVAHFDIEIDVVETFDSPEYAQFSTNGTTYTKTMSQLLFGTTYYWRARARHAADASDWSDVWNFVTLDVYDLKKPNNGLSDVDLNPLLRWDDISGIKKFDYQIDNDPNFITPDQYTVETYSDSAKELRFGTTYHWRSRGRHDHDTTMWAEPFNFTTAAAVELDKPVNGVDSTSLKPQLKWSQIKGVNSYEVSYALNETFDDAFTDFIAANDGTSPFYNVLYNLLAGKTYYWRVRACTEIDTSAYSTVFNFTTLPPVGIEDMYFTKAGINIFPNPATTEVTVQMNFTESVNVEFALIDLVGQTLIAQDLIFTPGLTSKTIDLSNLSNGIYLVKMKKGSSVYTNKLIINN